LEIQYIIIALGMLTTLALFTIFLFSLFCFILIYFIFKEIKEIESDVDYGEYDESEIFSANVKTEKSIEEIYEKLSVLENNQNKLEESVSIKYENILKSIESNKYPQDYRKSETDFLEIKQSNENEKNKVNENEVNEIINKTTNKTDKINNRQGKDFFEPIQELKQVKGTEKYKREPDNKKDQETKEQEFNNIYKDLNEMKQSTKSKTAVKAGKYEIYNVDKSKKGKNRRKSNKTKKT